MKGNRRHGKNGGWKAFLTGGGWGGDANYREGCLLNGVKNCLCTMHIENLKRKTKDKCNQSLLTD